MDDRDEQQPGGTGETGPAPETDDSVNPTDAAPEDASRTRAASGREMLVQLQQMIDTIATQAAPVMREVAVKAAELAAVAGEKAGPVAYKAADMTAQVGQRLAARSKDFAAEIRRQQEPPAGTTSNGDSGSDSDSETTASPDAGRTDDPKSSDWSAS